jgi:hypothetical protein
VLAIHSLNAISAIRAVRCFQLERLRRSCFAGIGVIPQRNYDRTIIAFGDEGIF